VREGLRGWGTRRGKKKGAGRGGVGVAGKVGDGGGGWGEGREGGGGRRRGRRGEGVRVEGSRRERWGEVEGLRRGGVVWVM